MKRLITSILALSMISASLAQASLYVPAADQQVRITGRVARNDGSVNLAFPGIEVELRVSGSKSVKMLGSVLSGDGWFNVYVDGVAQQMLKIPSGDFSLLLTDKLDPNAEHLIRLVRRNEAWQGVVRIDNFEVEEGAKILNPLPLPVRRIMAIGDSMTCGQNTELIPPATPGNHTANAELSYGWLLAKDFNAQINLVSYGGKGILRDWRGLNTDLSKQIFAEAGLSQNAPVIVTAVDFFERAMPDDASSVWDHSQYQPDLILICLGQNDFSQIEIPPYDYAQAYIKFVDRVHEVYPNAKIILMSSPMAEMSRDDGWMPRGKAIELALTIVNQHYIKLGNPIVMPVFMNHQPGTSIDSHPIAPQHRAMAEELKPIIKFLTNWTEE